MESTRRTADLISGAIWKVRYSTLVLLFQHEQLALSPYAGERAAMDGTGAVAVEGGEVVGGAVALVAGEAVLGELLVGLEHQPVARDLRDDRRRGDRRAARVSVDQVALRAGQRGQRDEVGDDELGDDAEHGQGLAHGQDRRLQDIDAVDGEVVDDADADGDGPLMDERVELFAPLGREELGVGQALHAAPGIEHHGRRHHGPRQRAPAGLVQPGDERDPGPPGLGLVAIRRRRGRRHAGLAGYSVSLSGAVAGTTLTRFSRTRAALPA